MNEILEGFELEKKNLKTILIGARMYEVCYSETFTLLFSKRISENDLKEIQLA